MASQVDEPGDGEWTIWLHHGEVRALASNDELACWAHLQQLAAQRGSPDPANPHALEVTPAQLAEVTNLADPAAALRLLRRTLRSIEDSGWGRRMSLEPLEAGAVRISFLTPPRDDWT